MSLRRLAPSAGRRARQPGPAKAVLTILVLVASVLVLAPSTSSMAGADAGPPMGLGGDGSASLGNQVANLDGSTSCPQYQPSQSAPCGPQPMLWTAVNGPYNLIANGDPYATKCAMGTSQGSPTTCDDPTAPNGAKNPLYRREGYAYAIDVAPADVGVPLTLRIYDAGQFPRTVGSGSGYDCNKSASPFNTSTYSQMTYQHCQTGDGGTNSPLEVQVFDNDGSPATVSYGTPITGCRLLLTASPSAATYKNKWATVCTFTPTQAGIYPFRTRSSGIPGLADTGTGINAFALRVDGGTATHLHALDDLSIWTNTPASTARFYLTEVGPERAGTRMFVDLFDPGDGTASTNAFVLSVKGPPGGAPSRVPGPGTDLPAPGVATTCRYNAVGSTSKGPATPDTATGCAVTTKNAYQSGGIYNERWLRIAVDIDPGYTCATDCWWSIQLNYGAAGLPTDRTVWSVSFVDPPVLSAVSPRQGPSLGGTPITITGSHLTGATAVTVGGTPATNVVVVDDSTITATTPAHAPGLTNVLVTTPGGTTSAGPAAWFSYQAPGAFTGTVSGPTGPLGGIGVVWSPADHQELAGYTYTAADGTFTSGDLPAGDYKILIVDPAIFTGSRDFWLPQMYDALAVTDLDAAFAAATVVTVTPGATLPLTPVTLTHF